MAKQEDSSIQSIRKALEDGKAIVGTKRSLKAMRAGHVAEVFLTTNTDSVTKEDVAHFAGLSSVNVHELEISNRELGVVCKKPFIVSVLAIAK